MSSDPCVTCGNPASITDSLNHKRYCHGCYISYPDFDTSFVFPEPGSESEIAVVPRCLNCGCELCEALDGVWTDEENGDYCYRCRRDPNRAILPF